MTGARLAFDPGEALRALRRDPDLARLLRRCGPFTLEARPPATPFRALLRAIVGQQLNGRAAEAIHGRVAALYGGRPSPARLLETPDAVLRGAGLSAAKLAALRDLAQKALAGRVPGWAALRAMEDEAIIARLTEVRGIGRWTVEMLLIFSLGRGDVWPVDDFAVRKAYSLHFGVVDPKPRELQARAESWRPWRSVVAWYLWRSLEAPGAGL